MLNIQIVNAARDPWIPTIERSFRMTLGHLEGAIASLRVELTVPPPTGTQGVYSCQLLAETALGGHFRIVSRHEDPEQVINHAFARARRELRRGLLRPVLLPASACGARTRLD